MIINIFQSAYFFCYIYKYNIIILGFSYVYKSLYPYHEWGHKNRDIWLATPGEDNKRDIAFRTDPDDRPIEHPGFNK